jgi:hypothetical protein
MVSNRRCSGRRMTGSAISEMGPALLILLTFIFFPMLDCLGAAAIYGSTLYLNIMQTKEASVVPASDATSASGQVQKGVVDSWLNNGIGKFAKVTKYPETKVTYRDGVTDSKTKITYKVVTVDTKVTCSPLVTIFWFTPVPGLNAPMEFKAVSEAQMENPDDAG